MIDNDRTFMDWGETEEFCEHCRRPRAWYNIEHDKNRPIVECTSTGCRMKRGVPDLESRNRLHTVEDLKFSTPIS